MSTSSSTEVLVTADSFPNFDLQLGIADRPSPLWRRVFGSSLLAHLAAFVLFMATPGFVSQNRPRPETKQQVVPLYLPPQLLTQKAPNRQKPSPSIDIASLTSPAPTAPRLPRFQLSSPPAAGSSPKPVIQALPPAPTVTAPSSSPLAPGAVSGLTQTPVPPPPAPPKQVFQDVGEEDHSDSSKHKLAVPNSSVDNVIKSLAQSRSSGHLTVSDSGSPAIPGSAVAPHAEVELQSDPQGVDFRDYLLKILTIVRANWRQVLPESARMGLLRGATSVQFIINRDGSIPKLVTSEESGFRALDTAAVAGLSMSNPLPPLPPDFKGQQVRVAFTFSVSGKP